MRKTNNIGTVKFFCTEYISQKKDYSSNSFTKSLMFVMQGPVKGKLQTYIWLFSNILNISDVISRSSVSLGEIF